MGENDFRDKENFEKIIKVIFYIASLKSNRDDSERIIRFPHDNIIKKFQQNENLYSNTEEVLEFKRSLFENAKYPYYFESDFLLWSEKDTFLPTEDIKEFNLSFFNKNCDKKKKFSRWLSLLFYRTGEQETKNYPQKANFIFSNEVKETMRKFILEKDLDTFLSFIIYLGTETNNKYIITNHPKDIFDSWENFEAILNEQDEEKHKYLKEFKDFFIKFKDKNFKERIEYNFEVIPK